MKKQLILLAFLALAPLAMAQTMAMSGYVRTKGLALMGSMSIFPNPSYVVVATPTECLSGNAMRPSPQAHLVWWKHQYRIGFVTGWNLNLGYGQQRVVGDFVCADSVCSAGQNFTTGTIGLSFDMGYRFYNQSLVMVNLIVREDFWGEGRWDFMAPSLGLGLTGRFYLSDHLYTQLQADYMLLRAKGFWGMEDGYLSIAHSPWIRVDVLHPHPFRLALGLGYQF